MFWNGVNKGNGEVNVGGSIWSGVRVVWIVSVCLSGFGWVQSCGCSWGVGGQIGGDMISV